MTHMTPLKALAIFIPIIVGIVILGLIQTMIISDMEERRMTPILTDKIETTSPNQDTADILAELEACDDMLDEINTALSGIKESIQHASQTGAPWAVQHAIIYASQYNIHLEQYHDIGCVDVGMEYYLPSDIADLEDIPTIPRPATYPDATECQPVIVDLSNSINAVHNVIQSEDLSNQYAIDVINSYIDLNNNMIEGLDYYKCNHAFQPMKHLDG